MSDIWHQKQSWIKDILSKSGTEITEIKEEVENGGKGDLRKMVYYTSLPLMMQPQSDPNSTLGHIKHEDASVRIPSPNSLVGSVHSAYPSPSSATSSDHHHHQPQPQMIYDQSHHSLTLTPLTPPSTGMAHPDGQRQSTTKRQRGQAATPKAPKPQFKCEQCNMMFGSKSAHTSHMKSHTKIEQKAQIMLHVNGDSINSTANNSSTNSAGASASPLCPDPYQCDVCHKTFAVPARLVRHYRTHTGERPFECEFCHKMFSVKENLQVHRRIHTKERPYKCDVCGRAFEHSGKLHRHMRIHTGERPHKCSVCGKTFIQSGQLVIHMRTHTGEKPYKCPVEGCGKGFTCSKQLKVHSRTHTGEKPYHCDICFRDFGYNHVLKLHRVQHYGAKCYQCTICDETFKSKKEMEAHIKGHANEQMPDEEEGTDGTSVSSYTTTTTEDPTLPIRRVSETDTSSTTSSSGKSITAQATIKCPDTPRDTSPSDAMSDADEIAYYQMYPHFDSGNYGSCHSNGGGVNPALLAAVSLAATAAAEQEAAEQNQRLNNTQNNDRSDSPIQMDHHQLSGMMETTMTSHQYHNIQQQHSTIPPHTSYKSYEPLALMRQHGLFTPVPKVEEFRSSISSSSSEIVKRVEAALAGAGESLLTPPRSSPESPDRSSSPESESMLMANRANQSLPLRKRKLYHLPDDDDTIAQQQHEQQQQQAAAAMMHLQASTSTTDDVQTRLSSVIQFAKAT